MADLEVDHEVRVSVTVDFDFRPYWVTIKITSTDHAISKVQLWNKFGGALGARRVWEKNAADTEDKLRTEDASDIGLPPKDGKPGGKRPDPPTKPGKIVRLEARLDFDEFPILVDVYEEASATELADGHRHGWFDNSGEPKNTPEHRLVPDRRRADDLKPWYGLWPGIKVQEWKGLDLENEEAGEIFFPLTEGKPGGQAPGPPGTTIAKIVWLNKTLHQDASPAAILVDVYEETSATQPAIGHRHGWFDSDGELKSTAQHKVDPAKQAASDLKCWYGLWPGIHIDKHSGELPVPPDFADD